MSSPATITQEVGLAAWVLSALLLLLPLIASCPRMAPLQAFALMNAAAVVPANSPACAAAYPGAEMWKCLFGSYALPYVQARGWAPGRSAAVCLPHLPPSAAVPALRRRGAGS